MDNEFFNFDAVLEIEKKKSYDEGYQQGRAEERAEILSEIMGEMAMLNETKMTEGDLKGFAYRIKAIAEQMKEQNNGN